MLLRNPFFRDVTSAAWLVPLLVLGCRGSSQTPPAKSVSSVTAASNDLQRCRDFMAALAVDDMAEAERDFDAKMRAAEPPALLGAHWHSVVSKHGPLAAWRVLRRDGRYGKDRFTLELEFASGTAYALVVFERDGQLVGLFFSEGARPASADASTGEGEVAVSVGPLALSGSLTLAQGAAAPAPGVVLVAGSGPSDRDESVGNVRPFRDLARGLAERGVASLRFDKRTYSHPESFDKATGTVETETVIDAIAAVELLRSRPEVDAKRIFIVGHSLGALLAPEIAERAGGVAGMVLLGAPARPAPEVVLEQLRASGVSAASLARIEAKVKALNQLAPTEIVLGAPALYWQDLAQRHELERAASLHLPTLLLRGERDRQVAALDQQLWQRALSGSTRVEAKTFPGLGHLFVAEPSGTSPVHVPAEVVEEIADFVKRASAS